MEKAALAAALVVPMSNFGIWIIGAPCMYSSRVYGGPFILL
jgi:hypothetical protein